MRVCLLNDSFPPVIDGVANVVLNYARIMQTENLADVMVATPKYPNTDYSNYPYKVIPYSSFDTTKIVKGYRAGNPLDLRELNEMADFAPDIIHTHCPVASTYVARMLRARTDAPMIFTYHTKFDEDIARAVKSEFLQKETVKILVNNIEACDEVWVVSQGAGENMKSLGYEGDYRVVSNGVDFAKGRVKEEDVLKVIEGYDLPKDVPVFLFVGRIIAYKGIPVILDAMKILSEKGQDYRMVFVGSGPDLEIFKEKARELGLYENPDTNHPGKCYFTGPIYDRDALRAWNTRADLFLFPSTYDTNGIVVREAAACGLASVLINNSCAAEGITNGRNGFIIEKTPEDMAGLLLELSKDLSYVHDVGQHAMDEIYISWEDTVHLAHERYGEIIDLKKSGKIPPRNHMAADALVNSMMQFVSDTNHIFDNSRDFYEGMKDNVQHSIDDMRENVQQSFDDMKENVQQSIDDMKENVQHSIDDMKENVQQGIDDIKNKAKEVFYGRD